MFTTACARLFAGTFTGPPAHGSVIDRIRWGVECFAEIYDVYAVLLQRAPAEPAAAELLQTFDRSVFRRLTEVLAPQVAADQLDGIVETIVAFTEGLLGRRLPLAERDRRLTTALRPC